MSWITLTETDLKGLLAGAEYTAIQSAALATAQADPVPQAVIDAIELTRSKVAGCLNNYLGDEASGEVIPKECRNACLNLARYYACSRVPAGLINPERRKEYEDALKYLDQVAACSVRIELPQVPTTQRISGPAMQLVSSTRERASRHQTRGL
jgi:phage gp36-like protein